MWETELKKILSQNLDEGTLKNFTKVAFLAASGGF